MAWIHEILSVFIATLRDVAPIVAVIVFFQLVIIRRPFSHLKDLIIG